MEPPALAAPLPNPLFVLWDLGGEYGIAIPIVFILQLVWLWRLWQSAGLRDRQRQVFCLSWPIPLLIGLIGFLHGCWRIYGVLRSSGMLNLGNVLLGLLELSVPMLLGAVASTVLLLANIALALKQSRADQST